MLLVPPRRLVLRLMATLAVVALALATPGPGARAASPDAASARGLDVLVAGASSAAPGASLAFAMQVVGYRTVLDAAPVEGATVELSWDPTQLKVAPPAVRLETDAEGRASGQVVMPVVESEARLLVTARHGGRTRSRTIAVRRLEPVAVDLIVPESDVVPGTRLGAWVRVRDRVLGRRLAGVRVVAELLDGGVTRERTHAVTDATGSALVFLRVPRVPDGARVSWSLRASLEDGAGAQSVALAPREETPAQPTLDVAWEESTIDPGATGLATIRLRDASREPLAGAVVTWTVTPLRPEDETEDDWEAARQERTDHDGRLRVRWIAPGAIVGSSLGVRVAARVTLSERTLERSAVLRVRPRGGASFTAQPEAGPLVPGVPQRILLRVRGDDDRPVTGPARATGDGLAAEVLLDDDGEAELTWTPPADVGSRREVGPCARSVAATITLEDPSGRLTRGGGKAFACVTVDRQREALLHVEPAVARAGEAIRVRVLPRTPGAAARPTVVVLAPLDPEVGASRAVWIPDGEAGASVELPAGPAGAWSIAAHTPRVGTAALSATGALLVTPRLVPRLDARVVGGRIAAGGEVEIEARLTDDAGRPVDGLVAALLFDAFGGTGSEQLLRLDTRVALCEAAAIARERCDDAWRDDAAGRALVRGSLATLRSASDRVDPLLDPGRTARPELEAAFAATLKSLEGAVFEASSAPERLVDARRDGARGRTFNPELFHIVTASLATPPTTPGGEPIQLSDLVAIDPQVRFDVVARRVTRLKLFRVLQHVREHRHAHDLDLDEPVLADPNALLARLTASGDLAASALLDPWGGTLAFRRARGGGPSVASLPGWELSSPGPDGRPGTGDDVTDPFARVVTSGSPYARALDEDAVVLARSDVRVAAETVGAWSALLERSTGTSLGNVAHGEGHGRLGGSHRTRPPSVRMGATMVDRRAREPAWELPTRTVNGVARLRLPLGSLDTTYRVVVVGLADGGDPAVTLVDVPVATPIAAQVDTGPRWMVGDELDVPIRVRNRTSAPARLAAHVVARGAAALAAGETAQRSIVVPARGAAVVHARVRAVGAGDGVVEVTLRDAANREVDAVRATVPVEHPGRRVTLSRSRWVDGELEIPVLTPGSSDRTLGPTRLVVEGGLEETLVAALRAVDPDVLVTGDALVDAIETGARVRLHAVERGDDRLARRAATVVERARGRLQGLTLDARSAEVRRAHLYVEVRGHEPAGAPCDADAPPDEAPAARGRDAATAIARAIALLESEPSARGGASASCWEALATDASDAVGRRGDPVETARLVLAFAERPHRREETRILAVRLARMVTLTAGGHVSLPAPYGERREARALVLAALLRGATAGARLPATRHALRTWLLVQRDGTGAFGSPTATRSAVVALLADTSRRAREATELQVVELDEDDEPLGPVRTIRVGPDDGVAARTTAVGARARTLRVSGRGGALVRLERDVLRVASPSTELLESPLRLTVEWPARPRAGGEGLLRIAVRSTRASDGRAQVHVPLPAGVTLAEPVEGVRAVPGALLVDASAQSTDEPLPARIPIRFGLAGQLAIPEATARLADEVGSPAYAPPRRLRVMR